MEHPAQNPPEAPMNNANTMPDKSGSSKVWMIVAIIAFLALIGLGIYSFMQMKRLNQDITNQKAEIASLNSKIQNLETTTTTTTTTTSSNSSEGYLKITQWGVEFKHPNSVKDLQYSLNDPNSALFDSNSLNSQFNTNIPAGIQRCGPGSLGGIVRGTAKQLVPSESGQSNTFEKSSNTKVGDYYYLYQSPQSACGNANSSSNAMTQIIAEMPAAFKSLQAIK